MSIRPVLLISPFALLLLPTEILAQSQQKSVISTGALAGPAQSVDAKEATVFADPIDQAPIPLPDSLEGLPALPPQEIVNPLDRIFRYTDGGVEYISVYQFRATHPSAALWFDQATTMLKMARMSQGLGKGEKVVEITSPLSPAPNGLMQVYSSTGAVKSTALAVMNINGWIIKVRSTSAKLKPKQQALRMARLIAKLGVDRPVRPSHPLRIPDPCDPSDNNVAFTDSLNDKPPTDQGIAAGLRLVGLLHSVFGGKNSLSDRPDAWCQMAMDLPAPVAAVYRPIDTKTPGWEILLGDSGRSMSATSLDELEKADEQSLQVLSFNRLDKLVALAISKGTFRPERILGFGMQYFFENREDGIASFGFEGSPSVSSPFKDAK